MKIRACKKTIVIHCVSRCEYKMSLRNVTIAESYTIARTCGGMGG